MIKTPREIILVVLAIVVAVLLAYCLLFFFSHDAESQQDPQLYAGIPLDAKLLELDKRALDEAYHAQLIKLFGVWLSSQAGDATAIKNGLRIARRAYNIANQQIQDREKQLHK